MKHVEEFRDRRLALGLLDAVHRTVTRPWTVMEVCGGQTHAILRHGLDQLLPDMVTLVHGPGCPVCVTPIETLDRALALAGRPEVILASYGDMLRVPGRRGTLQELRARGGDVRVVDTPLAALDLARQNPDREVVFLAVGFETTAPATALLASRAHTDGARNLSLLCAHVLVPPAMEAILAAPDNRVQGFLAAGHVCAVVGWSGYEDLARRHGVPIVPTGFEPLDILDGLLHLLRSLEAGEPGVVNRYRRVVRRDGNPTARELVDSVFTVCDRAWRGLGTIPASGLRLRDHLAHLDAERRFALEFSGADEPSACLSGEVLRGLRRPDQCPEFGRNCTPATPLGATMVSGEGACAAYWQHGRHRQREASS